MEQVIFIGFLIFFNFSIDCMDFNQYISLFGGFNHLAKLSGINSLGIQKKNPCLKKIWIVVLEYGIQTVLRIDDAQSTIIIIKTLSHEVFGAYCSSPWNLRRRTDRFFGTNECFLFKVSPLRDAPIIYQFIEDELERSTYFMCGKQAVLGVIFYIMKYFFL